MHWPSGTPAGTSRCRSACARADSETRLRRLDLEPDNFRAALAWLLDNDAPAALRLADLLGDWWLMRGRLVEGRGWLEAALERSQEADAGGRGRPAARHGVRRALGRHVGGRPPRRAQLLDLARARRRPGDVAGSPGARRVGLDTWPLPARTRAARRGDRGRAPRASPLAEANASHVLGLVEASARDLVGARAVLAATVELLDRVPGSRRLGASSSRRSGAFR